MEMKNIYCSRVDSLFTLATKPIKTSSIMVVCFALVSQDPQHLLAFLSYELLEMHYILQNMQYCSMTYNNSDI